MITYIDTKNRAKYQVLFEKAENVLKNAENLPAGIDRDSIEIATLNQYFAYLQDLITVSSNENIKSYFLRLPLDEELFEINANTRNISIPRNFAANGVGVQGDETAEIIYFSIDRFFDHTDLADDSVNIVIQWETRDKDRKVIQGISPNFGKDIETIPGKIIFGWPIYSELTESATPIKFSVRLFSLGEIDNETDKRPLNYSLATLPTEISVGSTIDYDLINKTVAEIDRGRMIIDRVKNNPRGRAIYDPSAPIPSAPTISTPLFVEGKAADVKVVDLPEGENEFLTLKVSAHPTDQSAVLYKWNRYAYNPTTRNYDEIPSAIANENIEIVYSSISEINEDDMYYRKNLINGVEVYEPVLVEDILAKEDNEYIYDEDEDGFLLKDSITSYITLYKKYSTAKVNSVGIYTVDVGARYGVNSIDTKMDQNDGIKIPGPSAPVIEIPAGANVTEEDGTTIIHVIASNGAVTLTTTAAPGEEDENAQVALSYFWKKINGGMHVPIEEVLTPEEDYSLNEEGNELTLANLATSNLDEEFITIVTIERNKVTTSKNSSIYRITNAPQKPTLICPVRGQRKETDYLEEDGVIDYRMTHNGVYQSLSFSVKEPLKYDSLSYYWVRVNTDYENDFQDGTLNIKVDIGNQLNALFADQEGNDDIILSPELGEIIVSSNDDETLGSTLRFNEDFEEGYYYCIVVNNLNNHRAANVTPFYSIH